VAEADLVLSATLVAVIVNGPARAEENVTEVVVWFASDPPVVVQVAPAPPRSFVTVALIACVCNVVNPPRFGLMETVIVEGCVIAQLTVTLVMFVRHRARAVCDRAGLMRGRVSTVTL
jgi:hypothetical protein